VGGLAVVGGLQLQRVGAQQLRAGPTQQVGTSIVEVDDAEVGVLQQ
jgi:hypothetical protein